MTSKTSLFSSLSELEQARFLASFAHQLTLHGRDSYEVGTERVSRPELLRRLNEVQHRVTAAISERLSGNKQRYPDAALISIIAGPHADAFSGSLHAAFRRAWQVTFHAVLSADLPR